MHPGPAGFEHWPLTFEELGDASGLLYLLVGLSMVPAVKAAHAALGAEASVTAETCRQIWCFNENYKVGREGRSGILAHDLDWLRNYVDGSLFRRGRFEYRLVELPQPLRALRHRRSGEVVVLMPPGTWLDGDGFVVDPDDPSARWESTLRQSDRSIEGCPVDSRGTAQNIRVTLSTSQWATILAPGDLVLDMHIPAGGGMKPDLCAESFASAFEFFDRMFPDRLANAVFCTSWIFNPLFEQRLPDSNFAGLMREVFLFPVRSDAGAGLDFVFCRDYDDWSQAPCRTRLQRTMIDVHTSGGKLRVGGMLFFRDELDRFGTRPYRSKTGRVEST
ncbi:MAG: hypothetical protein CMJ18_22910 [Phycisphaeraceae bacterium]|nr:hypothetical protein [Phycisphaeraceae bacterium]